MEHNKNVLGMKTLLEVGLNTDFVHVERRCGPDLLEASTSVSAQIAAAPLCNDERLPEYARIKPRLRCRKCDEKGQSVVSIRRDHADT